MTDVHLHEYDSPTLNVGDSITLSPADAIRAAQVGAKRQAIAVTHQLRSRHNNGNAWECHIQAAASELAVAQYLGLPWTGEDVYLDRKLPRPLPADVGEKIEVRLGRALYLDSRDPHAERFYVLTEGAIPTFRILGFLKGAEAAAIGRPREYPERTVWVVEPSQLRPLPRQ